MRILSMHLCEGKKQIQIIAPASYKYVNGCHDCIAEKVFGTHFKFNPSLTEKANEKKTSRNLYKVGFNAETHDDFLLTHIQDICITNQLCSAIQTAKNFEADPKEVFSTITIQPDNCFAVRPVYFARIKKCRKCLSGIGKRHNEQWFFPKKLKRLWGGCITQEIDLNAEAASSYPFVIAMSEEVYRYQFTLLCIQKWAKFSLQCGSKGTHRRFLIDSEYDYLQLCERCRLRDGVRFKVISKASSDDICKIGNVIPETVHPAREKEKKHQVRCMNVLYKYWNKGKSNSCKSCILEKVPEAFTYRTNRFEDIDVEAGKFGLLTSSQKIPNAFCLHRQIEWVQLINKLDAISTTNHLQNADYAKDTPATVHDSAVREETEDVMWLEANQLSKENFSEIAYCIGFHTDVYFRMSVERNRFILFRKYDRNILASVCGAQVEVANTKTILSVVILQPMSLRAISAVLDFSMLKKPRFYAKPVDVSGADTDMDSKK
uniref:AlNc14C66G4679 protein n=1 Tax=Albugo laibachii Nc14 TaxID=890382 RepID=F0WDF9_9STRA|nr:AlNc14C66G4679 [Albugo laibachii Nc14]|eukprot:CCA19231.1 AlNc14C66G4679 [Albugo laibachii Nc14]